MPAVGLYSSERRGQAAGVGVLPHCKWEDSRMKRMNVGLGRGEAAFEPRGALSVSALAVQEATRDHSGWRAFRAARDTLDTYCRQLVSGTNVTEGETFGAGFNWRYRASYVMERDVCSGSRFCLHLPSVSAPHGQQPRVPVVQDAFTVQYSTYSSSAIENCVGGSLLAAPCEYVEHTAL